MRNKFINQENQLREAGIQDILKKGEHVQNNGDLFD